MKLGSLGFGVVVEDVFFTSSTTTESQGPEIVLTCLGGNK